MSQQFLGEIRMFAFDFPPRGWALCNGQLLSIAQNSALFALLGTTYGGNGVNTFALPNLQGRVPVHVGQGPGLTPRAQGEVLGAESVTLFASQMPQHAHALAASDALADRTDPSGAVPARAGSPLWRSGAVTPLATGANSLPAGGAQPHANMMPFLVVQFAIALQGVFPSRN